MRVIFTIAVFAGAAWCVSTTTSALPCARTGAGNEVLNGDFSDDLFPWRNADIINEGSYGYNDPVRTTPGAGNQSVGHSVLFTFPADGIYEFDQTMTLPGYKVAYTFQFAARTNHPGTCFIIGGFGDSGTPGYQRQVSLSYTWQCFYLGPYTLGGATRSFVAIEVQCTGGTNNAVYVDKVALLPT